jgi:hypothetical protein
MKIFKKNNGDLEWSTSDDPCNFHMVCSKKKEKKEFKLKK